MESGAGKKRLICILMAVLILMGGIAAAYIWGIRGEEPSEPSEPTTAVPTTTEPPTTATETVPTEPETTGPQPIVETTRATITVTGDIIAHEGVTKAGFDGTDYNYDSYYAYIKDYVSRADLAVANLETTLAGTENGREYSSYPRFNGPDAMVDALKNAGFDLLLTANNHSNDTGLLGLTRTQEVIADRGLLNLGTTRNAEDPDYRVLEVNGIRVGMVCYTYGKIDDETGQKSVNGLKIRTEMTENINVFAYDKLDRFYEEMEQYIAAMKEEGAEAIVLLIHWGNEYKTKQNSYQKTIAQKMCDLGVDVIAGGHPHVIQPVELLSGSEDPDHKTLCVYSVGNALSNQRAAYMKLKTGHTEDGMLFSFTFVKYSNGQVFLDSAEIVPTWVFVRDGNGTRSFDILPLDRQVADWQAAFGIGEATLEEAQASYERTIAIIGSGMEKAEAWFEQSRAQREEAFGDVESGR